MNKLLYTPGEAAELLGMGKDTVYRLIRAGALRKVKVGSATRIAASDLEALVHRLQEEGGITVQPWARNGSRARRRPAGEATGSDAA
jgi:excisionase family DNA binding protein